MSDLQTDLRDGLVLVELIESIASPRKVGRYNRRPAIKPQMIENLATVLNFLEREQIKIVNIGKIVFLFLAFHSTHVNIFYSTINSFLLSLVNDSTANDTFGTNCAFFP